MEGIILVIVTEDGEYSVTCRTVANCPSLNGNGDSSRHSMRPSERNYFSLTIFVFFPGSRYFK